MNDQVKEIEIDIEHAKEMIKLEEAMLRLKKNKDFELLILEEYFKNEAVRYVEALSSPNLQAEKYQEAIHKAMRGIGELKQFFNKISHNADMARSAIEEGRQAIDEMAEDGEL